MILNPLLATHGFDDAAILLNDDDTAEQLRARAEEVLKEQLKQYASRPESQDADDGNEENEEDNVADASTEGEHIVVVVGILFRFSTHVYVSASFYETDGTNGKLSRQERLKQARKKKMKASRSNSTGQEDDQLEQLVKAYLSQPFNMKKEIKDQRKRMNNDEAIDWNRVEDGDVLYASSHFDMCEWWRVVGRKVYAQIYPVVPPVIAVPSSNDFQERTFSACTFFDDVLRQRLKEGRFEMAVLLAKNESLLNKTEIDDDRAKDIIRSVMEVMEGLDLGIDLESEALVCED